MQLPDLNKIVLLIAAFFVCYSGSAQIKIGTAPTVLEKSALLELNGNRQGLLLPRLNDTAIINTLSPPDGMLIYFQPANNSRGLYLRKSGYWQRLTTDSLLSASLNSWSLTGNTALTGSEKLGPLNSVALNLVTANTNRLTIDGTGNISLLGNTALSGTFTLNPATTATDVTALLLNGSNTVVKRNLNTVAFNGAIQSINSITSAAQTLQTTGTPGILGFTSSGSTHTLSIPDADVSNRGFINTAAQTYAGNKTFSNNLTVSGTTVLSPVLNTSDTSFLMINSSNQVTRRNFSSFPGIQNLNGLTGSTQSFATSGNQSAFTFNSVGTTHTLNIPDADATFRGFVNIGTQTFAGNKTYSGNIAVNGTTTLSAALTGTDTSFLLLNGSNVVVKRNLSTLPFGIQSINGLTASAQTFATSFSQTPLAFNSLGSVHTLNFPDADATYRGLVNIGTQSFSGNKTFSNNLTVSGTSTLAGATSTTDTIFLMTNLTNSHVERRNISNLPFIQSINTLTSPVQTVTTTNTAGPLAFTSSGSTHTLAVPDADISTRGFVNTTTQALAGNKTFQNNVTVTGTTQVGSAGTPLNSIIKYTVVNYPSFTIPGNKVTNPALGSISQDKTAYVVKTFTVPGAQVGASVIVNPSQQMADNSAIAYARVSATNTVEVKFTNNTLVTFNGVSILGLTLLATPSSAADITVPTMNFYFTIIQ